MMKRGLIVAAQPTFDRTVVVDHFEAGKTYRISSVRRLPSGKAINVARSLNSMGCSVHVVALLGGFSGQWILDQLTEIGVDVTPVWVAGENRVAYSIYDPSGNILTELIEDDDGPVTQENWQDLEDSVEKVLPSSSFLVISGRASKGSPETGYRRLVEQAISYNVPVYLDCYGKYLAQAISGPPTLVKINAFEAEKFVGFKVLTLSSCLEAATRFLSHGVKVAVITLGEEGAIAVDDDTAWHAVPPRIEGAAVGSGDVFMAGLVHCLNKNYPLEESLRYSVAAGTANVLKPGAGVFELKDIESLISQVKIRPIPRIFP